MTGELTGKIIARLCQNAACVLDYPSFYKHTKTTLQMNLSAVFLAAIFFFGFGDRMAARQKPSHLPNLPQLGGARSPSSPHPSFATPSRPSPFPGARRRNSASNLATKLRGKALIESRPPSDRRASLSKSIPGTPTSDDVFLTPGQDLPSPPTTRSGRKRRLTPGEPDSETRRQKMSGAKSDKSTGRSASSDSGLLADIGRMMEKMKEEIKTDIAKSETSTVSQIDEKIDGMAKKLNNRMDRAETDIKKMNEQIASTKTEILRLKANSDKEAANLPKLVEALVSTAVTGNASLPSTPAGETAQDVKYWKARRTLKLWPVEGSDLEKSVRDFLTTQLLMEDEVVRELNFDVKALSARPGAPAAQKLVTFSTIDQRDAVKAAARNLRGNGTAGVQMDPPDHLRRQYQTFQQLAYQIKKRNPLLKRNVKFDDVSMNLIMDINTGQGSDDGWQTIRFEDAKETMKTVGTRSGTLSKRELTALVTRKPDEDSSEYSDCKEDDVIEVDDDSDNNNDDKSSRLPSITFLNTNARSLSSKLESLADCIYEKSVDLAIITETWYQNCDVGLSELYKDAHSLSVLVRNRTTIATNGRQYGGLAIVSRNLTTKLEHFPLLNPEDHEVLAATGKVKGIPGKLFVLACYAPPNLTAVKARKMTEFVVDIVAEAKRTIRDCTVIVAGDFNQWPFDDLVLDHPDVREVEHGPTRGDRSIDRSFTNFHRSIEESGTLEPLETEDDRQSDHRVAWFRAVFPKIKSDVVKYTYRAYTEEGAANFVRQISEQNWDLVYAQTNSSDKAIALQSVLDSLMDKNFVMKTTTKRLSDPPWFNERLRILIKKRRKIYDREGRSRAWKKLKKKSDNLAKKRAAVFFENKKKTLTAPDAVRNFYKNVKAFSTKENPPQFDPRDLYPGKTDNDVASKLAEHFNAISSEFKGLEPGDLPDAPSSPLPLLTIDEVKDRLRDFKKPKSMVQGDIFPDLVNRSASWLALPLTDIYNTITVSGEWPNVWKTEYVTPIPKNNLPQSPNDLRNISCTKFFSKAYETFVLRWLTGQVTLRSNQYGGMKGCGTEHFLVHLWQQVLENLEDPRAASILTSIDYAKAFNRLDFSHCLKSLKAKGACRELLSIVASFLTDRRMRVKIGNTLSLPRSVLGGVPQGSILGVFLFNCAIDEFEALSPDVADYNPPNYQPVEADHFVDLSVPVIPEPTERDYRHLPPWITHPLQVLKYVDDNIILEKISFEHTPTDGFSVRYRCAVRTQNLFRHVVQRAEKYGMKVNALKTESLCIAELHPYLPVAYFHDSGGTKVQTGKNMKILGFYFSSDPNMAAQVSAIRRKFTSKIWVLRHLSHNGFSKEDLLKVYKSVIRPSHDYCSTVYNSSLTQTQSSALERLQAQALKAIFGYEYSYRALLEMSGLETLKARRDERSDKFARKCTTSAKFCGWFPQRETVRDTRNPLPFCEYRARTNRLYNSPLYFMRRRLNGKPG